MHQLVGLPWFPILVTSPKAHLPWPKKESNLAKVSVTRPEHDMWLVSYSWSILDGEALPKLREVFGWNRPIPSRVLATQLLQLSQKAAIWPAEELHELTALVAQIYKLLQGYLENPADAEVIRSVLHGKDCVWVGTCFPSFSRVAFSSAVNAQPYLYEIPQDMRSFEALFKHIGVKDSFGRSHFVKAISDMKNQYKDTPLNDQQLDFLCVILNHLGRQNKWHGTGADAICLPRTDGVLIPAQSLLFDDAPWLSGTLNRESIKFVHQRISNDLAARLGAGSLRALLLVNKEFKRNVMCPSEQHITNGLADLKGIPDYYALFDIMEIADLLQARNFAIILDERSFPTESLFNPMLADLQDTALCLYFDVALTGEDVLRIQSACSEGNGSVGVGMNGDTHLGHGLLSAYQYADSLVIISG